MNKDKDIYVITRIGSLVLDLPANQIINVPKGRVLNHRHWERCTLFDIVEEKQDHISKTNLKNIKRETRWIAKETNTDIIHSLFGTYLNPGNHIVHNYHELILSQKLKTNNNE